MKLNKNLVCPKGNKIKKDAKRESGIDSICELCIEVLNKAEYDIINGTSEMKPKGIFGGEEDEIR